MPTDQPIACTLTATQLPGRLAEIRAIGDAHLQSATAGKSKAILRFSADPEARERLAAIVAAESRCCSFLEFDLEQTSGGLVLQMAAPEGGELVIDELVAAFRGESPVSA